MMARELLSGLLLTVSSGRKWQMSTRCALPKKRYPENAERAIC